jgi:hypothetical protein
MRPIRAWWYKEERNVGDSLSPIILFNFLSSEVVYCDNRNETHLLGIGSIILVLIGTLISGGLASWVQSFRCSIYMREKY